MVALASNRKRSDECWSLNHQTTIPSSYFHTSKKRRFSFGIQANSDKPVPSSNITVSRMSRYPDAKAPFKREVHAPSRGFLRFGLLGRSSVQERKVKSNDFCEKDQIDRETGSVFRRKYDDAKKTALDALRYYKKDKEVVDLDDESEKDAISEDSNTEEVEVVEVGREKLLEETNVKLSSSSGITDVDNGNNLRIDDAGKMLDSLSLNREVEDSSGLEAYKKLLESVERRKSKLEALSFEIVLNEKRLSHLRESHSLKKPAEKAVEVPREPFIPLTDEEELEVQRAFSTRNRKVLVTHENSNIDITGEVLQCLTPTSWLNDEVINVYLELLKERETREPRKFLKCHFFSTFFYKKLVSNAGYNYKAVRRWTTQRKLGYCLIDCDKIFVPIHRGVHWTLAIINNRDRKFQYLDSLNGIDPIILNALAKYLVDEAKDKRGKDVDVSSWEMEFVEDLPQQHNGYDCGMFMLKYIDFYSRGLGLHFRQEHMPYFRLRTAKEILRLRAD
ncbi:PREDICTED: ubiquitin-like-specific protease ESD4 isoform X2 [Tarenaya hassleriana]|uniref:ubiquitin-like-specific protease ESD4 isoform X2 n=1 Tax=Tarenaya hassleriana TaxID=28532 RepID=UPI00053C8597|nr:PREDICTED: ubiquitin-like-specific protease ESD4 isoform X2 [Tarenaya hassleriana]